MKQIMSKKNYKQIFTYLCCGLLATGISMGCNVTKNVPDKDALYTGATIKMESSQAEPKEKIRLLRKHWQI